MSLMHEVEDSHLSQLYAKHMSKLQALCSLSVLLRVAFGHPLSGRSFPCSTPVVLHVQPAALEAHPEQGVVFTQLRAVCGPWDRSEPDRASPRPAPGPRQHPLPFQRWVLAGAGFLDRFTAVFHH